MRGYLAVAFRTVAVKDQCRSRQGHGKETSTRSGQSMSNVVTLLRGSGGLRRALGRSGGTVLGHLGGYRVIVRASI